MAYHDRVIPTEFSAEPVEADTIRDMLEFQRIGNIAVRKAQEENRRLGIPNWYSLNGKLVSDRETAPSNETNSKKPVKLD